MKALALAVCATVATFACSTEPAAVRVEGHTTSAGTGGGPAPALPSAPVPADSTTTTTDLIGSPTTSITSPTTTTTEPEPETVATTVPRTTTTVRPTQLAPVVHSDDFWFRLAMCESGGKNVDTGNGYSGYFQFSDGTWRSMDTGYARAVEASYAVQLDAAQRLQARSGWGQWPACARQLGLS